MNSAPPEREAIHMDGYFLPLFPDHLQNEIGKSKQARARLAKTSRQPAIKKGTLSASDFTSQLAGKIAAAIALRNCRDRPAWMPEHPGNCTAMRGEWALAPGRPLVPFELAASAAMISIASACLRTSTFGRR